MFVRYIRQLVPTGFYPIYPDSDGFIEDEKWLISTSYLTSIF